MKQDPQPVDQLVGHLFRHESGRLAAVLTKLLGPGQIDEVEDIVQDTLLKALEVWKYKGTPANPTAWLFTVARRKAIDRLRTASAHSRLTNPFTQDTISWNTSEDEIQDAVLRFMFAACHPTIAPESQIAFTLKTLGGLSVQEIASAFMTTPETIAKRIYRAKEKLREDKIVLEGPTADELPRRLDQVMNVLYLVFNEGYYSSNPSLFIREDLCAEAMRLTNLLLRHPSTEVPAVKALLALMCFQAARFPARADDHNQLVLLEQQDRSKWNQELIQRGLALLGAASTGDWLTEYHVEAAIASVHAVAPCFDETNWSALEQLYETLNTLKPSPSAALNRAIAIGFAQNANAGLEALQAISNLEGNRYYHTALGEFYAQAGLNTDARIQFSLALNANPSAMERVLVESKIRRLFPGE